MKIVEIIRIEEDFKYGTFGVLRIDKQAFCVTLEPPDLLNRPDQSSIPVQQYICEKYSSPKYVHTFEVKNVPGRSRILFHSGNIVDHTEGCILLAEHFGKLRGDRAVLNSGKTFQSFLSIIGFDVLKFHLTIKEVY